MLPLGKLSKKHAEKLNSCKMKRWKCSNGGDECVEECVDEGGDECGDDVCDDEGIDDRWYHDGFWWQMN